jgi:hypothetical protein
VIVLRSQRSLLSRLALFARLGVLAFLPVAHGCSSSALPVVDRPTGIRIDISAPVAPELPSSATNRYPITFRPEEAKTFVIDVTVIDANGSPRASFDGHDAWVRLQMAPGQIVSVIGPTGVSDPDVVGSNVHLKNGQIKGVKVVVIGAYGDSRIVAQDVGFVPAAPNAVAQCQNGVDDDGNGLADYPVDPGCYFLNDDSEGVGTAAYGVSPTIYYAFPRIHDVQGGTSPSRFVSKQVEILGDDTKRMIVTSITNDGMYVTDIDGPATGFNSLFVYNFNAPYGVRACDKLTRLAGNVSNFFGFTELGTPGWSITAWISDEKSGPCPIPDFPEITDAIAAANSTLQPWSSALVKVKTPTIGTHFGPKKVENGAPSDGASNCDLNGDGVVGFSSTKSGFSDLEKACNDACTADESCSEWNNFQSRGTVKIKFGLTNGLLYFDPGAVPTFDVLSLVGPNKFAEIRGTLRVFLGPTPAFTLQSRCEDDIVYVGQDPTTIKDAKHACVHPRVGADAEGTN